MWRLPTISELKLSNVFNFSGVLLMKLDVPDFSPYMFQIVVSSEHNCSFDGDGVSFRFSGEFCLKAFCSDSIDACTTHLLLRLKQHRGKQAQKDYKRQRLKIPATRFYF